MKFTQPIIRIFVVFALGLYLPSIGHSKQNIALTAKSAIIMDANSGIVLFEKNSSLRIPAASTVKVLTAVMAADNLDFERSLTISKRAAGIAPSKVYLSEKQSYKVKDLLLCFLMSSANDAGVVLAEAMAKTEFRFSLLMNKQAKSWGANNSFFLNATGLPEYKKRQYSTVYDLALFMKKFIEYPALTQMMRQKQANISGSDGKVIKLRNHNKFLWRTMNDLIGKTGYTRAAKHCFLGTFSQGNKNFIVAIQGSRKPWDDLEYLIGKKY
ncbi:MAG: D-alanyl-D-alanine carboxypeptidase [Candidatus Omnitrophica bacterium]|nr:D-alanyl-D-alanine carboxypeptidase [Candidatus Omnitrophota bacterium]